MADTGRAAMNISVIDMSVTMKPVDFTIILIVAGIIIVALLLVGILIWFLWKRRRMSGGGANDRATSFVYSDALNITTEGDNIETKTSGL